MRVSTHPPVRPDYSHQFMWERQCKAVIRFDYPAADRMGSAVGECLFLREVRGTIVVPERENIDPPSAVFPVDY